MKVGIVGCGNIASFHLPHILRQKSFEALSIVDIDRKKAEKIAERFDLKNIYTDFETMIKETKPDVVHILTPPATHAELAIKAMELGCHVLVEKPMALTTEEAETMIAAAKKNAVKLCVDHTFLLDPNIIKAHELVQKGEVGRVVHVEASYSFDIKRICYFDDSIASRMHWLLTLPGGPLLDFIPHPLSILLKFLKHPLRVWAITKSNNTLPQNLPDELRVLLDAHDMTGLLSISLGIRPDCFTLNIYGTEMSIHVNLSNMAFIKRKNRNIPKKLFRPLDNVEQAICLLLSTFANSFKVIIGKAPVPGDVGPVISSFYESIENGLEPPITASDGKAVIDVSTQILQQIT